MRSASVLTVAATLTWTFALAVPEATAEPKSIKRCPFLIEKAGAYLLAKSLTAIGTCITVATDFVTIDLSGQVLTGDGTGDGITDGGAARLGISIYNGTVTNFNYGINLINGTDSLIRLIRAIGNTVDGIRVGSRSAVSDNIATSNGGIGIQADENNTIERNTASGNGITGINATFSNTIKNNTASSNGFDGIFALNNNTISHNTAGNNGDDGIDVSSNNTISHNTASSNGDDGIVAFRNNTISHNTASGNGTVSAAGIGIFATCTVNNVSNIFGNTAQQNNTNGSVAGCQLSNNVGF